MIKSLVADGSDGNRFRFKSFTEQISQVDISILKFRNYKTEIKASDESQSYFYEGFDYWRENNLSATFQSFALELSCKISANLATIVFYANEITDLLLDLLKKHRLSDCAAPTLHLLCLLAKDLRSDFYTQQGERTIRAIVSILEESADAAVIEQAFVSLSFLFKFLSQPLLNDFARLLDWLIPLLQPKRGKRLFTSGFCSDAIGYLLRRAECSSTFLPPLIDQVILKTNEASAVLIFFSLVASVRSKLHKKQFLLVCEQLRGNRENILLPFLQHCYQHLVAGGNESEGEALFREHLLHRYSSLVQEEGSLAFDCCSQILAIAQKNRFSGFKNLVSACVEAFRQHYVPIHSKLSKEEKIQGCEHFHLLLRYLETVTTGVAEIFQSLLAGESFSYCCWFIDVGIPKVLLDEFASAGCFAFLLELPVESIQFLCYASNLLPQVSWNLPSDLSLHEKIFFFPDSASLSVEQLPINFGCFLGDPQLLKAVSLRGKEDEKLLLANLSSGSSSFRLATLKILESSRIIEECISCESIPCDLVGYRQRFVHLKNAEQLVDDSSAEIFANFLFGSLLERLQPFRSQMAAILEALFDKIGKYYWDIWLRLFNSLIKSKKIERVNRELASSANAFDEWCDFVGSWFMENVGEDGGCSCELLSDDSFLPLLDILICIPGIGSDHCDYFISVLKETRNSLIQKKVLKFLSLQNSIDPSAYDFLLELLLSPDSQIQTLAADCLFLVPHIRLLGRTKSCLRSLAEEKTFSSELFSITLKDEAELRWLGSRKISIPLAFRIALGRLAGASLDDREPRRKAIFRWASECTRDEVAELLQLVLKSSAEMNTLLSLLRNLEFVFQSLRGHLLELPQFSLKILLLLAGCVENEEKRARSLALKRLAEYFSISFPSQVILEGMRNFEKGYLTRRVAENKNFAVEFLQSNRCHLLCILEKLSLNAEYSFLISEPILKTLLRSLEREENRKVISSRAFSLGLNIIQNALKGEDSAVQIGSLLKVLQEAVRRFEEMREGKILLTVIRCLELISGISLPSDECLILLDLCISVFTRHFSRLKCDRGVLLLKIISSIGAHSIDNDRKDSLARSLAPLLLVVPDAESEVDKSLISGLSIAVSNAQLLQDLAARNRSRMGAPDFDRRLLALARLRNPAEWSTLELRERIVFTFATLRLLQNREEFVFRDGALATFETILGEDTVEFVLSGLSQLLGTQEESVRSVSVALLIRVILKVPNSPVSFLRDEPAMRWDEEEAAILPNFRHIQLHRRARAITRFSAWLRERSAIVPERIFCLLFLPLLEAFITEDSAPEVADEAITALGVFFGRSAEAFHAVRPFLKWLQPNSEKDRFAGRLLLRSAEALPDVATGNLEFCQMLQRNVFPSLFRYLNAANSNSADDAYPLATRSAVAVATMHLLKKDVERKEGYIGRLFTLVSAMFRSRSAEIRDAARDILARILRGLGISYLRFAITEVEQMITRSACPIAIAIYTAWYLLERFIVESPMERPSIDCFCFLLDLGLSGFFLEHEVPVLDSAVPKVKEAKNDKSQQLVSTIFQSVPAVPIFTACLQVVKEKFNRNMDDKFRSSRQRVIDSVSGGMALNQTMTHRSLLAISFVIITAEKDPLLLRIGISLMLRVFGQRSTEMLEEGESLASMVHPFIQPLQSLVSDLEMPKQISRDCLKVFLLLYSNYCETRSVVIQALSQQSTLSRLLENVADSDPSVSSISLRLVALLLDDSETKGGIWDSSEIDERLKILLLFIAKNGLESFSEGSDGLLPIFAVLKAAIRRHILINEMVDAIEEQVLDLAITNSSSQVRERARQTFLLYLFTYPLNSSRLGKLVRRIVGNLEYPLEPGREAAIELAFQLITRLDMEILGEFFDLFFMSISLRLAKETTAALYEKIENLILTLANKGRRTRYEKSISFLLGGWLKTEGSLAVRSLAVRVFSVSPLLVSLIDNDSLIESALVDSFSQFPMESARCVERLLRNCPKFQPSVEVWNLLAFSGDSFSIERVEFLLSSVHLALNSDRIARDVAKKFCDRLLKATKRQNLILARSGICQVLAVFAHQFTQDADWLFNRLAAFCRVSAKERFLFDQILSVTCGVFSLWYLKDAVGTFCSADDVFLQLYTFLKRNDSSLHLTDDQNDALEQIVLRMKSIADQQGSSEEFLSKMQTARSVIESQRDARREDRKRRAIADPVRSAKEKRRKTKANNASRKRKSLLMKNQRTWGS